MRPVIERHSTPFSSPAIASRLITAGSCPRMIASPMRSESSLGRAGRRSSRLAFTCPVAAPAGKVAPLVLAAAKLAGVDEVYRVGGAQGVAALAYGTASIAPVAKIVGPGNAYVATAKRLVFGKVGIDM